MEVQSTYLILSVLVFSMPGTAYCFFITVKNKKRDWLCSLDVPWWACISTIIFFIIVVITAIFWLGLFFQTYLP